MKMRRNSLKEKLNILIKKTGNHDISVSEIVLFLAGTGQATLLILLSLPFCLPIQIPGLSTLFGIIIILLELLSEHPQY